MAKYARKEINEIGGYYAFCRERANGDSFYDFDITKLSVHTLDIGLAGIEVYDILRDEYNIQIEFGDLGNILAYLSIGDRQLDLERLVGALAEIRRRYEKDKTGMLVQEYIEPDVAVSPQEAFYAEKEKRLWYKKYHSHRKRVQIILKGTTPLSRLLCGKPQYNQATVMYSKLNIKE